MKKKLLTLLMCAGLAFSMTACGDKDVPVIDESAETGDEPYHFEVIVKSFQATYWQAAVKGVDKACEEQGVTANCSGPATESDIADQVQMLGDAIAKKPSGIALSACDSNSVLDSLKDALAAGIPVVCFDAGVNKAPEGSVVATVATDNTAAGVCAAENMFPVIKDVLAAATVDAKVRIGVVNQDATALNIQQRGIGFINKMIQLCAEKDMKCTVEGDEFYVSKAEGAVDSAEASVIIEVVVPAQTTVELSAAEAQKVMAKDDTVAMFGSNQVTAEGMIVANGTLNKLGTTPGEHIIAVGFDAGAPQKEAVKAGMFIGSVTQAPFLMGYECINTLVSYCNGETVADIPTDVYWYNAENMEDENIAQNLYN